MAVTNTGIRSYISKIPIFIFCSLVIMLPGKFFLEMDELQRYLTGILFFILFVEDIVFRLRWYDTQKSTKYVSYVAPFALLAQLGLKWLVENKIGFIQDGFIVSILIALCLCIYFLLVFPLLHSEMLIKK